MGFLVFLLTAFENHLSDSNAALNSRKSEILVVLGRTLDLGLLAVVSDLITVESPREVGVVGSNTCASMVVVKPKRQIKTQVYFNCCITERRPYKFANKYPTLVGEA